ncbi:hypothetical protein ACLOJK_008991 [Asimina triloba]
MRVHRRLRALAPSAEKEKTPKKQCIFQLEGIARVVSDSNFLENLLMVNLVEGCYLNLSRKKFLCEECGLLGTKLISFWLNMQGLNMHLDKINVCKRRVEAAVADFHGLSSFSVGMGVDDKMHPQTAIQKEVNGHGMAQPVDDQLSDSSANVTRTDPANNKSTEGLQHSNSFLRGKEAEPMAHRQVIIPCSNCGFRLETGGKQRTNEHVNSLEARNSNGHLLNPTNSKAGSVSQVQHRNMVVGANPVDNSAGSSSDALMEACPASFQFFVTSEEGINLYVDLTLSPSEWVKRLKDEVCMYRKVHHSESRVLHRELGCLGDGDEFIKTSMAERPETSLQDKGVERNIDSVCVRSLLSTTGIENSHCGAHNMDETNEPSSSTPVVMSGHSDEAKRVVSSSSGKPDSDVQSEVGPVCILPQSLPGTSVKMATSMDGLHCPSSLECRTSKSASVYHKNAEARIVGVSSMVSGVSEKSSLPYFGAAHEEISSPRDSSCLEKHGEVCQGSSASGATEMHLAGGIHGSGSSTYINHLVDQPKLDSPPDGVEVGNTQSAGHQPVVGRCCGQGSPGADDQISAFAEEQWSSARLTDIADKAQGIQADFPISMEERGAVVNEKESSE